MTGLIRGKSGGHHLVLFSDDWCDYLTFFSAIACHLVYFFLSYRCVSVGFS